MLYLYSFLGMNLLQNTQIPIYCQIFEYYIPLNWFSKMSCYFLGAPVVTVFAKFVTVHLILRVVYQTWLPIGEAFQPHRIGHSHYLY